MPCKKLTKKQMKIARVAGNPNKIDAADFKKLKMSKKKKKHAKTLSVMIPPANEESPEPKGFHISVEGETFKHSWEIEFYAGQHSYSKV